jgi:hypothetical protein
MSYLFIALSLVALFHFIYESILAPTWRFKLRLELFELRDEFRRAIVESPSANSDVAFAEIQDSINNTIRLCPSISASLFLEVTKRLATDKKLSQSVDERIARLDACAVPKAQEIRRKSASMVQRALAINTGGWSILIVPPILAWLCLKNILDRIQTILAMPFRELEKMDRRDTLSPQFG